MSATTAGDDIPNDWPPEYYTESYGEGIDEEEESIVLNSEDFISGPFRSDKCTVHNNIFEMDYSYGYDCKKHFNLVAPDKDTVVWIGGNVLHFLDVKSGTLSFRRSYLGGGIGHIAVNPNPDYPHFTVAENGDNPPIIIYEWPSLEIVGILKDGAAKRYAHINYSPDGELLVSQSYGPDFLITVWNWKNWKKSGITLRTKSHVNDVFNCMFSPYVPGQITTGGSGHIKFWKMAQTFTGLKLKGELGRFGKTEISDIIGVFPMPDEKVISGTEWGNLLVWEAGLIKIEVMRTMRRSCHSGPIMQIEYIRDKDEIWTISHDGWMRAWEYRIIDEADPPDEDRVVQMVPSFERQIQGVKFQSFCKRYLYEPENMFYYAQDANGGIWLVDMALSVNYESPKRLKASHAGKIMDMCTCPWGPYIVTLGEGGKICLHNYEIRKTLFHYKFNASGVRIIWLPLALDPTGTFFLSGFDDGVVRVFHLDFQNPKTFAVKITQSIKPHNKPLTEMALNPSGTLLVTGGEDGCVFIFQVFSYQNIQLHPIGFVPIAAVPTCFTWFPYKESVCLVGCRHGELFEFDFPTEPLPYTKISYLLYTIKPVKQRFTSCKAQIRRDLHIAEIERQKAEKIIRKKVEIERIKAEGLDVDEDQYLQDSEEEEELEPLHIPEVPNPIFFMVYTPEDTIWLSMGGYDAGYMYEYQMDQKQKKPLKATIICDADDIEMHQIIFSPDGHFIIIGMQDGSIRVCRLNRENFRDFSDYWQLSMHDNYKGRITKMCFSYDNKLFFSCGEDGNIFSYIYNPGDIGISHTFTKIPKTRPVPPLKVIEVDLNYESLSLEEVMIKAEQDKQMKLANEHKKKLRLRLKELTAKLNDLLDRNCKLPSSQRYPLRQLIVDERIMKALDDELEAKVALERRKLAYDVEKSTVALRKMKTYYTDCLDQYPFTIKAINTSHSVNILVSRKLGEKFFKMFRQVDQKLEEEHLRGRLPPRKTLVFQSVIDLKKKEQQLEPFLVGLSPSTIAFKLGIKLTRLLEKYRARKRYQEERQEEWNTLFAKKPVEGANHPDDESEVNNAKETIGDFKLKSSKKYKVPPNLRETTVVKYKQLLEARLKACKLLIHNYNQKVIDLRNNKKRLINKLKFQTTTLESIHKEIPEYRILLPPPIPTMEDEEFAENEIELKLTVENDFKTYLDSQKPMKEDVKEDCLKVDWEKEVYGISKLPDVPGDCRDIINHLMSFAEKTFTPYGRQIPEVDDGEKTYWDQEIEYRRYLRKIHDQRTIIAEMNRAIQNFDDEVKELAQERFRIILNSSFLEMHILVLNEELTIIRDFEVVEIGLSDIAFQKWNEMMDQRDNMTRIELTIEGHQYNIEAYQEDIKGVQQTFLTAAKDNKFWDFLRRIFKKKYRPPKVAIDSDSSSFSSESSSDSEDDEDTGSIDSRDIGPIRLDESICPKGCDKELYDFTFTLRSKRHELERLIKEEQKSIEMCKKEIDQAAKKVKLCEQTSNKAQDDLEDYQALKQQKLNEVNCLVLLHLHQLQHINPDDYSFVKLSDTLLFNTANCGKLFNRVNELKMETLEQLTLFRKNKLHQHRMNIDCEYMRNKIAELKKEIQEKMILKFGSPVKIDDIEEAILKRMVLNLRVSMLNIGKMYASDVENLRILYGEKQIELRNVIRENTARLEVLAIVNKEKGHLEDILQKTAKAKENMKHRGELSYYSKDVDKLQNVVKKQKEQIETLKAEIKALNTKTLPPEPIPHEEKPVKEEIELSGDFGSLDELYDPSNYLPQKDVELLALKSLDQIKVTEEEIVLCIHELIKEVIDAVVATDKSEDEKLVVALSEIVDQVPMEYLQKRKSIDYIAGLVKDMVQEATCMCSEYITAEVARATRKSVEEIAGYVEKIKNSLSEPTEFEYEEQSTAEGGIEDIFEENWIVEGEEIRDYFESKSNTFDPNELD